MKILKTIILICITSLFSCERNEVMPEVPEEIITTNVDSEVLQEIGKIFPNSKNFINQYPYLFEESNEHNIVLTEESEVYLTFVIEGASLRNSLGYYIYNSSTNTVAVDELDLNILFPHINDEILNQGDMLQLGNEAFPSGTTIGFFLIIDGWNGGEISYENQTFFTNAYLNLEEAQQHVLIKLEDLNALVLAFEDQFANGEKSDQDYNDVVFTLSDNQNNQPITRFNLEGVPTLIKSE
ncbi:DUF4114 domain-containing protein [Marivirga sp.]|uniref:DUF4114 domain-containing protein n=1 Tax=Marivirga sp. TaxID=2018662 RepID=UPI002D7F7A55|nr:DUF4114 domain-containing protein [Marivirga sp.]HET8858841.1 DUF4114 domain-containing protein [Marivirga sp.]